MVADRGATYYASLSGISRWQEGQLRTWNENEGLASESVHAIGRGGDGAIWAATSGGVARFDGQNWRPVGSTELTTRGLAADGKGRLWVATAKGLRALPAGEAALGADPAAAPVVLAGEMRDVAADRLGRIWAMSTTSIALVQEK
jgi:ligand-binding sensor domain-containing protein